MDPHLILLVGYCSEDLFHSLQADTIPLRLYSPWLPGLPVYLPRYGAMTAMTRYSSRSSVSLAKADG